MMKSFTICFSETALIFPHFWRKLFPDIRFLVDIYFHNFKQPVSFPYVQWLLMRNQLFILLKILCMNDELLLLCHFPDSFFALGFWQFGYNVCLHRSFCIYPCWSSLIFLNLRFMVLPNLGNFWPFSLFSNSLSSPFRGSCYMYIGMLHCIQSSLRLCLSSHLLILFFASSKLQLNPLVSFYLVILLSLFISRISLWLLFIFYLFNDILYSFIYHTPDFLQAFNLLRQVI